MNKSWNEMYAIDVSEFCDERDKIKYLNWAKCKKLLHDNGAKVVYFEPLTNSNGSTLFMSDEAFVDKDGKVNRCYEVRVKIVIDDLEFVQNYPLLNGNVPVKDNSLNQLRLSNAQARAFVKGVAIRTGLGFQLWCEHDETTTDDRTPLTAGDMQRLKALAQEEYTRIVAQKKMSGEDIVNALGLASFDTLKGKFAQFDEMQKFILDLQKL